jgi:hypothetical protein
MKRFLSPQVPLLVFRSDPAATKLQQQQQQRCGCVVMMKEDQEDREGECGVTATITPSSTPHACECPTDACYACGLDQGEVEVPIQERGQNCSSNNNNGGGGRTSPAGHRPFHLFITVCMHGNEKTGLVAMNELIAEGAIPALLNQRGGDTKLTVMVGNPRAVTENKRFMEKNLNRIIHPTWFEKEDELYEARRARLVARMALSSDQWLDVHSTSSPCTAYALPTGNQQSEELAEKLDIGLVISKLAHHTVEGGTSCDWALQHNKTCVCVECGQEGTREAIESAKRVIMSFIVGHRLFGEKRRYVSTNQVRVGRGFRYARRLEAFEHVAYNELLAIDDEVGEIRCPFEEGAVVIMPTSAPIIGEEAWFWGRQNLEIESV